MFNGSRLTLARKRRGMSRKSLAEKTGISHITVARIEKGLNDPMSDTIQKISQALSYPEEFFYGDEIGVIQTDNVSFRSLSKMSAKERDAAIAAGRLGVELVGWVDKKFNLPEMDLIDLRDGGSPAVAARYLRQHWNLGVQPIPRIIKLLEAKGVRVLSLSENTESVDAFSFWQNNTPYIFLNNFKSPERSIFDAAHELGHLVLHKQGGSVGRNKQAEKEANLFAASFLMPEESLIANMPRRITTKLIIAKKRIWRVSAMALAYRCHQLELLSDWNYRQICIELARGGYRDGEPEGIVREKSEVWEQVLRLLWIEKKNKNFIAKELNLPLSEIDGLIFGLVGEKEEVPNRKFSKSHLKIVK